MKMSATYLTQYSNTCDRMDFVVQSLAERPGRALQLAIDAGGAEAMQALFDAVMDAGHRQALVQTLESPALPQWVRDHLWTFLYGRTQRKAALFQQQLH